MVTALQTANIKLEIKYIKAILEKLDSDRSGAALRTLVKALNWVASKVQLKENHVDKLLEKLDVENSSIVEKMKLVIMLRKNNDNVELTDTLAPFWNKSLLKKKLFENKNNNENENEQNNKIDSKINNE